MSEQKSGKAKLNDVGRILSRLETDLHAHKLSSQEKTRFLEQLKVYGRSTENADPIFTTGGLRTLGLYAFGHEDVSTSQEALRCIANALLLQPQMRQMFVDLGHGPHAAERLESESIDDEFLLSRILFLTTYNTNLDYPKLVQDHALGININLAIERHASRYTKQTAKPSSAPPMQSLALSETLKLLFNITHFNPTLVACFTPSIPHIFDMMQCHDLQQPAFEPPSIHLINALINFPDCPWPSTNLLQHATYLIELIGIALSKFPPSEFERILSPILILIRRLYACAPAEVQSFMASRLLPSPQERDKPLGKSDTLAGGLLKLTTEACTPELRSSISALLFECSGKDANKFIENVGYGFAAGFLASNNIAVPEGAIQNNGSVTGTQRRGQRSAEQGEQVPVNPITGQRLDREAEAKGPEMTEEEKEREAERLFVLFERLRATGVVDVQNPIEQAFRSGRIEELPDDAIEE